MILITGATGQLGTAVVTQLLRQSALGKFTLFVRDRSKAQAYIDQGIPVRVGDFDDPASLPQAFAGISKLLLISSRSIERARQQKQVVDAAVHAGVRHIVYTGLAIQDIATSHTNDLMQSHFDTEAHIRASGVAYTFLRNTMYADALPEIIGEGWSRHGINLPGGDGQVPYALRREMGEATANLLLQDDHAMRTYDITGRGSHTYLDVADALGSLTGQTVSYTDISEQAFAQHLQAAGLPDFLIYLSTSTVRDVKDHQYELRSDALRKLLGREPAGLEQMIKEVFAL